jgi:hypothetical protein
MPLSFKMDYIPSYQNYLLTNARIKSETSDFVSVLKIYFSRYHKIFTLPSRTSSSKYQFC